MPRDLPLDLRTWARPLNQWHDEVGVFHLRKANGWPLCGAQALYMSGPYPYEPGDALKCCRCRKIAAKHGGER